MIPHWLAPFLWSNCVVPVMFILVLFAASLALIRFNDWYLHRQATRHDSDLEYLETLFALEDNRTIGHRQS